ncbi:MAG: hypothetical protein WD768_22265 [Phycisphaeraceae bacterium]
MNNTHHRYLTELTSLPTAAGCEQYVVEWIANWAVKRGDVEIESDRHGNLVVSHGPKGKGGKAGGGKQPPIYFTAHLDHPAFVVRSVSNDRQLLAEFRGGVHPDYFMSARVLLHHDGEPARVGRITAVEKPASREAGDIVATVRFTRGVLAMPGDILTWKIAPTRISNDRVSAPACDDLAGVAAAIAAFDAIYDTSRDRKGAVSDRRRTSGNRFLTGAARHGDVRLLFTRCEEVGFIGAIGACKAKTIPRNALVIALENSKSFAESPIGGGPIVRVGDRTSTFDPDLTYRIGKVAEALAAEDNSFQWQRKLMVGGTCEASAYQTYGHTATCICLPLGNYHNMNETKRKIDSEVISLRDYDNLVKLLATIGTRLHDPGKAPPLKVRLEKLFESRRALLK